MDNIASVDVGLTYSAAVTKKGDLYTWGDNEFGQLGNGTRKRQTAPVKIKISATDKASNHAFPSEFTKAVKHDLKVAADNKNKVTVSEQTVRYQNLKPDTCYNFYVVKDCNNDDILSGDNLLYIGQFVSDKVGKGHITYGAKEDYSDADIFCIAGTANKDEQMIAAANSITKTYSSKSFNLGAKAKTKLTYKSSNTKVAAVNSDGKVTIKGPGKAIITITAAETVNYKGASKKVAITIKPQKALLTKASSRQKGCLIAAWKKDSKVTGYQVLIAQNSKFTKGKKAATVKTNKTTKKTFKKLKSKKTYYVKVRTYKKSGKTTLYGPYSSAKKVRVK